MIVISGNEDEYEYRDRKDNAWLGATMALHQKADLLAVTFEFNRFNESFL